MNKVIIGTRGSKLALWQAHFIKAELERARPDLTVELNIIKTEGDARHDLSPGAFGREGIFTAELDRALTDERIDLAVHSLKDLPTKLPQGLCLAAATTRAAVNDVLLIHADLAREHGLDASTTALTALQKLKGGITVGTSSLRRIAQLKHRFPGLEFAPLRGNLDTRIRKLSDREIDAAVVAQAGLDRLELSTDPHLKLILPPEISLPAAGQGSLALETRDSGQGFEIAGLMNDPVTRAAVVAERTAMSALGAGCRVPAGFLGEVKRDVLFLKGVVGHPDGNPLVRAEVMGPAALPEAVGEKLAKDLLGQGAADILKEVRE